MAAQPCGVPHAERAHGGDKARAGGGPPPPPSCWPRRGVPARPEDAMGRGVPRSGRRRRLLEHGSQGGGPPVHGAPEAASAITDDGHHAAIDQASGSKGISTTQSKAPGKNAARNAKRKERERARKDKAKGSNTDVRIVKTPPREDTRRRPRGGKGQKGRASQECWKWTKQEAGCQKPCPDGRAHPACPKCHQEHPWMQACPGGAR